MSKMGFQSTSRLASLKIVDLEEMCNICPFSTKDILIKNKQTERIQAVCFLLSIRTS
jgi:hypothetical protein